MFLKSTLKTKKRPIKKLQIQKKEGGNVRKNPKRPKKIKIFNLKNPSRCWRSRGKKKRATNCIKKDTHPNAN
jgi:hypothetical protein